MAGIQRHSQEFDDLGVKLIAASSDPESGATEMVEKSRVTFPVAYGITPEDIRTLGAWEGERQGGSIIQPCEFVIRPDGTVAASMYASVQIGRMDPQEVLRFISARIHR